MPSAAGKEPRSTPELDDVTLVRAQRGDEGACRALVERYQREVFALLSRLLGPLRGLTPDLAQETFLRVFRALPSFDHPAAASRPPDRQGKARLSTWILTIATRLAIDEMRRRRPSEPLDRAATLPDREGTDVAADRRQLGKAIASAVAALSPDQRAVFVLREAHGLEYEEIASVLGIDVGTVKSRLSRARDALRDALKEVHDG